MKRIKQLFFACMSVSLLAFATPSHAQWAVIDVAAIEQAVQEYTQMLEQYKVLMDQYNQAKKTYESISGIRDVGSLFTAMSDNSLYEELPPDAQVQINGMKGLSSKFSKLASKMKGARGRSTLLTDASFKNPKDGDMWREAVNTIASQEASGAVIYDAAGQRIPKIQKMTDEAGKQADQQGMLAIIARLNGESTALHNEQLRLIGLEMMAKSKDNQLRLRQSDAQFLIGKGGITDAVYPEDE